MKDKIKVFGILILLMGGIYLIATNLRKDEIDNIEFINKDYKITKGIVTKRSVHKGNHLWVKYTVKNKSYVESDGFVESQKFKVGDSIKIKYSVNKPELMITEFNDNY